MQGQASTSSPRLGLPGAPSSIEEMNPLEGVEAQQQQTEPQLPSSSGGDPAPPPAHVETNADGSDDIQPSKRQRQEEPPSYAHFQPSSPQFLTAFLTPGGALPAADTAGSLVGSPFSGIVDVQTDSCCFVTVTLAGQEFKGEWF